MTERHEVHTETLSNGCEIKVKAEILRDGSLGMFIGVYLPNGTAVEENDHPTLHFLDMEGAMEWGIGEARKIGNSQQTL